MDRFQNERGVGMVWVIILVILAIVTLIGGLVMWAEKEAMEQRIASHTAEIERIRIKEIKPNYKLAAEIARIVGFGDQAGAIAYESDDDGMIQGQIAVAIQTIKEERDKWRTTFAQNKTEVNPGGEITVTNAGVPGTDAIERPEDGNYKEISPGNRSKPHDEPSTDSFFRTLQASAEQALKDLQDAKLYRDQAVAASSLAESRTTKVDERLPVILKIKDAEIKALEAENRDFDQKLQDVESTSTARISELRNAVQDVEDSIDEIDEEHVVTIKGLENERSQVVADIMDFRRREEIQYDPLEIHGKIVDPDVKQSFAYINLGSATRLQKGMKFLVFRMEHGGKVYWKGEIEVKRVFPHTAQVSIVTMYNTDIPIVDGDLITNPLFNPRRPVVVAFAGDPGGKGLKYPTDEASKRILEMGSIVEKNLPIDADFLIKTRDFEGDRNYRRALELAIPTIDAATIYRFLGD